MSAPAGSIWFQGDWSDPWVAEIADAMPQAVALRKIDLAACLPAITSPSDLVILHRARLLPKDAERFSAWKKASGREAPPSTILCYGPFARYAELERWQTLVEMAIPEATAVDILPGRVATRLGIRREPGETRGGETARFVVVSTNADLRRTIGEACATWARGSDGPADFRIEEIRTPQGLNPDPGLTVTILDVPLLERGWEARIEQVARAGPVIALLGFPDRGIVTQAKRLGAVACLDLPFDREDLGCVLSRCLESARPGRKALAPGFDPAHRVPPPPTSARVAGPPGSQREQRILPQPGPHPRMKADRDH